MEIIDINAENYAAKFTTPTDDPVKEIEKYTTLEIIHRRHA